MHERRRAVVIGIDGGTPNVIEHYAREGALPNIARLFSTGTFAEACLPAMPTITPTCWATIATGATPAVHGCTCASVHRPGRPLDESVSAYWSKRVGAEFVWETAERAGLKALVVAYPTSWPPRLAHGIQIGGPGCGVVEYHTADSSPGKFIIDGVELQLFTTDAVDHPLATRIEPVAGADGCLEADLPWRIEHSAWHVQPCSWRARFTAENRVVFVQHGNDGQPVELTAGEWSGDVRVALVADGRTRALTCRLKLMAAARADRRLAVLVTPMTDLAQRAVPAGLGAELNQLGGVPPYWHHGTLMQRGHISHQTFLEIEDANFDWRTRCFRYLHEREPLDLVFQYSVMIDTINHAHRRIIEGYADVTEDVREHSVALERGAYAVADRFVGDVLDIVGPEMAAFLVSDHGSCGYSQPFRTRDVLKRAGLLVTRTGGQGEEIDWAASRAVPLQSSYIYVNLEGRDPTGIVPPSEYERTVEEIIAALYDAADPDTGKRMIALALRREDARLVGLGGPLMGDVVFAVAGGIGAPGGGVHAGQIPTARSRAGTQCSLLLAAGPGIRQGHRISRTVRQHEIAPTISRYLGIPAPQHAEGAAVREMLEDQRP